MHGLFEKNFWECSRDDLFTPQNEIIFPRLCANQTHFLQICDSYAGCSNFQLRVDPPLQQLGITVGTVPSSLVRNYTVRPGPWFNFESYVIGAQFGHIVSKFMQLYNLRVIMKECGFDQEIKIFMSHFTLNLAHALSTVNYKLIISLALGKNHSIDDMIQHKNIVFSEKLESFHKQFELLHEPSCFQDVIHWNSYETTFLSRFVADQWRRDVFDEYNHLLKYPLHECPKVEKVIFLYRNEGSGLRAAKNFDLIESVLREFGLAYHNESMDSRISVEKIFNIFSDSSLIISPHSSALKNLIFARKGTAVVELRPGAHEYRNPFADGLEHTDVVYIFSKGHIYGNGTRFAGTYRDDYYVNEEIFRKDLREALRLQRLLCGHIPKAKMLRR